MNWISVDDSLPDDEDPVLVYNGCIHLVQRLHYRGPWRIVCHSEDCEGSDVEGVTHWRHIPTPPEDPMNPIPDDAFENVSDTIPKIKALMDKLPPKIAHSAPLSAIIRHATQYQLPLEFLEYSFKAALECYKLIQSRKNAQPPQ